MPLHLKKANRNTENQLVEGFTPQQAGILSVLREEKPAWLI